MPSILTPVSYLKNWPFNMVDKELLSRKLSYLQEYVNELQNATDVTWEKYSSDTRTRAFIERYLHLTIESIFDIANHVIAFNNWREPDNYRDIFTILHEHNVVSTELLTPLQTMASFRNLLVHRYDKVDDEIVFGIFQRRLQTFISFIELIQYWYTKTP